MNRHLGHGEDGASAVEYGLLVTGIAGLIVAMVFVFGGFVGGVFSNSCTKVRDQAAVGNACS